MEVLGRAPVAPSNLHYCSNYCHRHPEHKSPSLTRLGQDLKPPVRVLHHLLGFDLLLSLKHTPLQPG